MFDLLAIDLCGIHQDVVPFHPPSFEILLKTTDALDSVNEVDNGVLNACLAVVWQ